MAPLSGRVYLEAYYDLTDPDYKSLESCIDGLEPWSMVTTKALEDTWPEEGWNVSFTVYKVAVCITYHQSKCPSQLRL